MEQSDYPEFAEIMLETAEAVDKVLTAEKIAVFFKDLSDLDIRAVRYALEKHRKESEFFPRVAKIREIAREWKPPALPEHRGHEVKLLESPEMLEKRRQDNLRRVRELLQSLNCLDARYGTSLKDKVSRRERIDFLMKQKEQVVNEGGNRKGTP